MQQDQNGMGGTQDPNQPMDPNQAPPAQDPMNQPEPTTPTGPQDAPGAETPMTPPPAEEPMQAPAGDQNPAGDIGNGMGGDQGNMGGQMPQA